MYNTKDTRVITNLSQLSGTKKKTVVLTFDDGPSKHLDDFLDVLKEEQVPAVFFWEARMLHHKRPWKRALQEGHIIGSHANRHRNLVKLSTEQQRAQIETSIRTIEHVTKQPVRFFRPPFGQYNEHTLEITSSLNLQTVMWSVTSFDWELKTQPNQIVHNVVEHLDDGAIILLHERIQTLEVLPLLIRSIRKKGFSFSVF
ncbi:polysaccharide deacetylase [Halalkalibacter wakoensis JCM 9140]|uniref:Polysaccharide deacetylase n=1 Tax=Halalkalibacter wakoensis JCM 9140 TaxID=1236970 RepID=W4Q0P6_9BACI|nr:polysaccharide deacetylase family protein [Halalkalibacter wakoensis]GAE24934.1 polysaccharide deacetylase [Halalkalibacter wakoensis JCM 9140]